jgi:hypothetical protein
MSILPVFFIVRLFFGNKKYRSESTTGLKSAWIMREDGDIKA